MKSIYEDNLEQECIGWFKDESYQYKTDDNIFFERKDLTEVILENRLKKVLLKINNDLPEEVILKGLDQFQSISFTELLTANRDMHKILTNGLKVKYMQKEQEIGINLKLIDFVNIENNDWLVVNQLKVQGEKNLRKPDLVVFLNGLPISVFEFKNPADEKADIWSAFNQLQTYKDNIPKLFNTNVNLIISDGVEARLGSLTADQERFMRWRTVDGDKIDLSVNIVI